MVLPWGRIRHNEKKWFLPWGRIRHIEKNGSAVGKNLTYREKWFYCEEEFDTSRKIVLPWGRIRTHREKMVFAVIEEFDISRKNGSTVNKKGRHESRNYYKYN